MPNSKWREQSIQQLEQHNFGDPNEASTDMVKRSLILCKKPIVEFTASDLRLMIGQGFALQYLIPLALEQLKPDPFTEADYYPGDLLKNVLNVETAFWHNHKHLWEETNALIKTWRNELTMHKLDTSSFDSVFNPTLKK